MKWGVSHAISRELRIGLFEPVIGEGELHSVEFRILHAEVRVGYV